MITKTFQNLRLSALGMGAMRLPVVDGNDAQIDEAEAARMVSYAMKHGINYYDTAWGYHDGNSETAMGKILAAIPGTAISWLQSSLAMTFPIWIRWKRFLKSSWKNAVWSILISICSITSVK